MVIKKKLIKYNHSGINKPVYIVIHETDNTDIGADAERHYKYFNGGDRGASAHYVVDDKQAIQLVEHNVQSWHNGKKYVSNPAVAQCNNSNSIGIEICVNQDGDYSKAVANAADLTKKLMKELNIPVDRVIRHYDSCGKQCPAKMLKESKIWSDFKKALEKDEHKVEKQKIQLNGITKEVNVIKKYGHNFVMLQDLRDDKIVVGYDEKNRVPVVNVVG